MKQGKIDSLFIDISTIQYRDTNIQFSVENILNCQYYPSPSIKPQQKIDKNIIKDRQLKLSHHKNKKEGSSTPRTPRKNTERSSKRQIKQLNKNKDVIEEKDTQDDSQTVKIAQSKSNGKEIIQKKRSKHRNCHNGINSLLPSNKIQLQIHNKQRINFNASLKGQRKISQSKNEELIIRPIASSISLKHKNKNKIRSETQHNIKGLQEKNEYVIRNDYFDEKQALGKMQQKANLRERQISTNKKLLGSKKAKKYTQVSISQNQKFNPKSPRLLKK